MKRIGQLLMVLVFGVILFFSKDQGCMAAETENVSVTVPANLHLVFAEDGTNRISDFTIQNQSLVPINVTNIKVQVHNGWQLVPWNTTVPADKKELAMQIEGKQMISGDNEIQFTVAENAIKNLNVSIRRGAWHASRGTEKAMTIEVEYAPGKKAFEVVFDGNGSDGSVTSITSNNGDTILLPVPTKIKHAFKGWKDEKGNLHNGDYIVPIGGAKLTAQWVYTTAYAIYSGDDQSFTFVRSETPIQEGSVYNGKTATNVFSGFEDQVFTHYSESLWWGMSEYESVSKVIVQDVIQPKGTAYWFFNMRGCGYYDLRNIDASQIVDMTSMFSTAGEYITDTIEVIGMGAWDTSNVKSLASTFRALGRYSKHLIMDDLSGWNTVNVTNMQQTFNMTGYGSGWKTDCSKWNVDKVTEHSMFSYMVEDNIIQPKWVN